MDAERVGEGGFVLAGPDVEGATGADAARDTCDDEGGAERAVGDADGVDGVPDGVEVAASGVPASCAATLVSPSPAEMRTVTSAATLSTPAIAASSSTGVRRAPSPGCGFPSAPSSGTGRSGGSGGCAYGSGTRGGGGWDGSGSVT
ncbi:hypothetical protein C1N81_31115 [Streptomyces sp. SGAir0957]